MTHDDEGVASRTPARVGRPSVLNDVEAQILAALQNGADRGAAAGYAGVPSGTFRSWLTRGRDGQEPFASFLQRVEATEAEAAVRMAKVVFDAAHQDHDVRAALEWLRRRRPDQWADPISQQGATAQASVVLVQVDGRSPRSLQQLTDEELATLGSELREEGDASVGTE